MGRSCSPKALRVRRSEWRIVRSAIEERFLAALGMTGFLCWLRAEEFAGLSADSPGSGDQGDVAGDIGRVVEDDDGLALGEVARPIEAMAGHGLVAADGKFESDHALAEAPEAGLLFCDDRADGVGAGAEKGAVRDGVDDDSREHCEENGNGEEREHLEFAGLPGMAKDDDEIEIENPKKEEWNDYHELCNWVQRYVARRVLEDEVAIGV